MCISQEFSFFYFFYFCFICYHPSLFIKKKTRQHWTYIILLPPNFYTTTLWSPELGHFASPEKLGNQEKIFPGQRIWIPLQAGDDGIWEIRALWVAALPGWKLRECLWVGGVLFTLSSGLVGQPCVSPTSLCGMDWSKHDQGEGQATSIKQGPAFSKPQRDFCRPQQSHKRFNKGSLPQANRHSQDTRCRCREGTKFNNTELNICSSELNWEVFGVSELGRFLAEVSLQ